MFYDASCALCLDWARRWERSLRRQGFRAIPLQTPGTAESLGVSPSDLLARMHLLTAGGRCFTGADAYVEMARARAWSRPLAWLASRPEPARSNPGCTFTTPNLRSSTSRCAAIIQMKLMPWPGAATFGW